MGDCPRLGKLFGGCRFRPRYDEVSAVNPTSDMILWMMDGKNVQRAQAGRKTYLGDVCETCGKMLFKRKATS